MSAADPLVIAQALLRCPSVTPAEGGALRYLEGLLKGAGFTVRRMTFSEPGTADIENLYARIGTAAPNIVFADSDLEQAVAGAMMGIFYNQARCVVPVPVSLLKSQSRMSFWLNSRTRLERLRSGIR